MTAPNSSGLNASWQLPRVRAHGVVVHAVDGERKSLTGGRAQPACALSVGRVEVDMRVVTGDGAHGRARWLRIYRIGAGSDGNCMAGRGGAVDRSGILPAEVSGNGGARQRACLYMEESGAVSVDRGDHARVGDARLFSSAS